MQGSNSLFIVLSLDQEVNLTLDPLTYIDPEDSIYLHQKNISKTCLLEALSKLFERVQDQVDESSLFENDNNEFFFNTCWLGDCANGMLIPGVEVTLENTVRKVTMTVEYFNLHMAAEHGDFGEGPSRIDMRALCAILELDTPQ